MVIRHWQVILDDRRTYLGLPQPTLSAAIAYAESRLAEAAQPLHILERTWIGSKHSKRVVLTLQEPD